MIFIGPQSDHWLPLSLTDLLMISFAMIIITILTLKTRITFNKRETHYMAIGDLNSKIYN